jgi:ABC-2 type transport system permease protein
MLLQIEMDNVLAAIRSGVPTLLVVDPVPTLDMRLAPAAPMAARVDPYANPGQALMRKNTGDIQKFMLSLGVTWPPTRIVWDSYTPHPELAQLPKEVVFIGKSSGSTEALSSKHAATSGLQELMMLYAGHLQRSDLPGVTFTPLVRTSRLAGTESYFEVVQPTPGGPVVNVNLAHTPEGQELVLAAEVRSTGPELKPLRAIVIADLDFISDQAFDMRADAPANVSVDNIPFFLNCIDVLAGDESFIELRKRRVTYRTLERVEAQTRTFIERRTREEQRAAAEAQAAVDAAQKRFQDVVESIGRRQNVYPQAKQIMARNVEALENRRLEVLRANIEQQKAAKIQASRETMEAEVRRIQSTIRMAAVLLPPVPACCLGVLIFVRRQRREREAAAAARRLRDGA